MIEHYLHMAFITLFLLGLIIGGVFVTFKAAAFLCGLVDVLEAKVGQVIHPRNCKKKGGGGEIMSGWFNPNTPASNRWRPGRKFKFGKHKGLKVYQVMRIDPAYILWASEAIPLDFSKNIIEDCQKAAGSKKGKYHNTNKKGGK